MASEQACSCGLEDTHCGKYAQGHHHAGGRDSWRACTVLLPGLEVSPRYLRKVRLSGRNHHGKHGARTALANLMLVSVPDLECNLNEAVRHCPRSILAQLPQRQVAVVELVDLLTIRQNVKEEECGHDLRPALIPRSYPLRRMLGGRPHYISPGEDAIPGDCPIRAIECEH